MQRFCQPHSAAPRWREPQPPIHYHQVLALIDELLTQARLAVAPMLIQGLLHSRIALARSRVDLKFERHVSAANGLRIIGGAGSERQGPLRPLRRQIGLAQTGECHSNAQRCERPVDSGTFVLSQDAYLNPLYTVDKSDL